jgi:hypothetical protein
MKQIESSMNAIESLLDRFKNEIDKIIQDASRSRLKGDCIYEIQQWRFFHCKRFPIEGVR